MVPVLVIDRDKTRLARTAGILTRYGYCALTARCEIEALVLLSELPVQLVLAEVAPADAGHVALIDTIRCRYPELPVVAMIEGNDAPAADTATVALDVAVILREPFVVAKLLNAVGHCLARTLAA